MKNENLPFFVVVEKWDGLRISFVNKKNENAISLNDLIDFRFNKIIVFNKKKYKTLKGWFKAQISFSKKYYPNDVERLEALKYKFD